MAAKIPVELVLVGKEQITSGLKDIAKAAGAAFAIDKIASFAMECRKAAQEDAKAQAQLAAAIGGVSIALDIQTKNLAEQYRIQQGNVVAVQNAIALHFKNTAAIKTLTPAILDMAEATGKSTDEIAKQLTSAIETGKGIKEYGIYMGNAKTENERIKIVAEQVTTKFSNQAKAAVDNKDALDDLNTAYQELQGNIGNIMKIPVVEVFANYIVEGLQGLSQMGQTAAANKSVKEQTEQTAKFAKAIREKSAAQIEINMLEKEQSGITDQIKNAQRLFEIEDRLFELRKKLGAAQTAIGENMKKYEKPKDTGSGKDAEDERKRKEDAAKQAAKDAKAIRDKEAQDIAEARKKFRIDAINDLEQQINDQKKADDQIAKLDIDTFLNKIALMKRQESAYDDLNDYIIETNIETDDRLSSIESKNFAAKQRKEMRDLRKSLKAQQEEELLSKEQSQEAISALERRQTKERIQFAKKEKEDKIEFAINTTDRVIGTLDSLTEALGVSAEKRKKLAQAEALISGAKGVLGVLENSGTYLSSFGPIGGPILMGVEMALITGLAIAQAAAINNAKMAYGGTAESRIITGGIKGQDSVAATLMPGEIVYNPQHPNPALAAQIAATVPGNNTTSSNITIGGNTIIIQGKVSNKQIEEIGRVSEKAILSALHKAKLNGKLNASGLVIRA